MNLPTKVFIVVTHDGEWLPKYASVGFYKHQAPATRAAKQCGVPAKVLAFDLNNPETVFDTGEPAA